MDAVDVVLSAGGHAEHQIPHEASFSLVELSNALPPDGTKPLSFSVVFIDNHDLVLELARALSDPIGASLVQLSVTVKSLRAALQRPLAELRLRRQEAKAMLAAWGTSLAQLRQRALWLDAPPFWERLAHWRTLRMLVGCGSLMVVHELNIRGSSCGDEGVASLLEGICFGDMPYLNSLGFNYSHIGPQGACAIAGCLSKRALSLELLHLDGNQLGDAGVAALAESLRTLPGLKTLSLQRNEMTDEGVAALLAEPMEGMWQSLERLQLSENQITDLGCTMLVCTLRGGALRALKAVALDGNMASRQALDALDIAVEASSLGASDSVTALFTCVDLLLSTYSLI